MALRASWSWARYVFSTAGDAGDLEGYDRLHRIFAREEQKTKTTRHELLIIYIHSICICIYSQPANALQLAEPRNPVMRAPGQSW